MKFDVQSPIIAGTNSQDKRVVGLAWSPDGERLAVAFTGRSITIITVATNAHSRIPVKGKDESSNRTFTISGISWAPDNCRFAVAQTDGVVAVYDIGPANQADAHKRITLRFSPKSAALCVHWPVGNSSEFLYGLADGSVVLGLSKVKKSEEIYRHTSPPLRMCGNLRSASVAVGHVDGSIFLVNTETRNRLLVLQTSSSPQALAWGSQVLAAGSDLQINFVDEKASSSSHVDFSNQPDLRAFTAASFDPSGSTAVVAARNAIYTFTYTPRLQSWTQQSKLEFDGLYSVPSLAWSPDGSRLAVSTVTGSVFFISVSIGAFRYKNLFDVVHVTGSQIKVICLKSKKELNLRSDYRVLKTIFQQDRYVISRTTQSFMVGDTVSGKTSEIPAPLCDGEPNITERFIFIDDLACLVWNTGELAVVELGKQDQLGSIPTQYASPYLLSLRFNAKVGKGNSKILAYLLDAKTVRVIDLESSMVLATAKVPNRVDWLELNVSGTMILFRDSKRQLYVYNMLTQEIHGILSGCSYAQWVPEANVIVAQSKHSLYVWYSPTSPDDVRVNEIEGDVIDIMRAGTKTTVSIQTGGKTVPYPLDGAFIAFSAAMESKKLEEASKILLDMKDSTELASLWKELSEVALEDHNYIVAEVAYSKAGNLPRARFLHKLNKLIDQYGINHCQVQAQIAMLQSNFKQAEYCLVEHGQLDAAIEMYRSMHMWNDLLGLAEMRCPQKAQQFRDEYISHLLETGQYQTAARLKANRGQVSEAVDLCLQGGKPQLAAELLLKTEDAVNPQLLNHVAEELIKADRKDIAGQVYEKLGKIKEALDAYRQGHDYYRALELARAVDGDQVVAIEKEWADHLTQQSQFEAATMHYVEAGEYMQALNCALRASQWNQAAEILRSASSNSTLRDQLKLQYLKVARHFAGVNDLATAEDLFLTVEAHKDLVDMYLRHNRVDDGLRHAKRHMKSNEVDALFTKVAKELEKKADKRALAEEIYLAINKPEAAIEMYNNAGDQDNAIRLSSKFGGDKAQLAQMAVKAEREGNFEQAETCYLRAGQWEKALFMYKQERMWADAMRVAKSYGKGNAELQVAIHWAKDIGGEAGVQKLQSLNMVDQALLYCCQNGITDMANLIMQHCKTLSRATLIDAHIKFATALEAQERYSEAEQHYIAAEQPREVVEMYTHAKMWSDAQRVAAKYGINDIPVAPPRSGQSSSSSTGSNVSGIKRAIQLEEAHKYDEAISLYLTLTPEDCGGESRLDTILDRAVKLTSNFRPQRLQDVVTQVAQTLIAANRHASLGKILEGIQAYPDAFEIYKLGNMWDDAKRIVKYLDPEDQQQFKVDYEQHLRENKDTSALIATGSVDAALQVYADRGEWEKCLSEAQKSGEQYVQKYTMLYAQNLVNKKKYDEAITVLARYSPTATSQSIPNYLKLCKSTLYEVPSYDTIQPSFFALRQMLFKVLQAGNRNMDQYDNLEHFTMGVHLLCQEATCEKQGMMDLAQKCALSLLRYSDVLPADFLFYKAGYLMEKAGKAESAMAFYNRFVDISDVIKSGNLADVSTIDHTAFEGTDIPRDMCLRKIASVSPAVAEKASEWCVEQTISSEIQPALPKAPCPKCGRELYAADLHCKFCGNHADVCHITGYPVVVKATCTKCGAVSNRAEWSAFIAKTGRCPCCDAPQTAGA